MVIVYNQKEKTAAIYTTKTGAGKGIGVTRGTILKAIKTKKPVRKIFLIFEADPIRQKDLKRGSNFN